MAPQLPITSQPGERVWMPDQKQTPMPPEEEEMLERRIFDCARADISLQHWQRGMSPEEEHRSKQLACGPQPGPAPVTPRPHQTRRSIEDELRSQQKESTAWTLTLPIRSKSGLPSVDEVDKSQHPKLTITVTSLEQERRFERLIFEPRHIPTPEKEEALRALRPTNTGRGMSFNEGSYRPPRAEDWMTLELRQVLEPTAIPLPFETYVKAISVLEGELHPDQATESWKQHTVACLEMCRTGYLEKDQAQIDHFFREYIHFSQAWFRSRQSLAIIEMGLDDVIDSEYCSDTLIDRLHVDWREARDDVRRKKMLTRFNRLQLRKYRRRRSQLRRLQLTHESLDALDELARSI